MELPSKPEKDPSTLSKYEEKVLCGKSSEGQQRAPTNWRQKKFSISLSPIKKKSFCREMI
jgi:hypothetical protein